jgi:signal transduction histidine kinase
LPALTRDLQFDYTAPELAVPQRLRFRYRLDGHDADWIHAGNRRQAFYTDLTPGSYRFDVSASEDGKSWNTTPTTLQLLILPAFYQTGWFAAIVVIVAGVLLWVAFAWQMRQMHVRMRARMEAQLSERERIARELHDTFLQGVQALMLRFQSAMEKIPTSQPARELMESALDQADAVLVDGRERVTHLRSLHRTSATLPTLLEEVGNSLARETNVAFAITVEGTARELGAEVSDELRHIASEALINAFRHARGTRVDLTITYAARALKLQIVDNGCGFDMSTAGIAETSGHWGLRGMRERAEELNAELKISSGANIGTAIEITVPASIAYWHASNPLRRWFGF